MFLPPSRTRKLFCCVGYSIPFKINCVFFKGKFMLALYNFYSLSFPSRMTEMHHFLLFKYLISSGSSLCVCCATCGEMLFSQLGNAGAFADALCSGQLVCSALLFVPVFCRNTRLGESFWVFIFVGNQRAFHYYLHSRLVNLDLIAYEFEM